MRNTLLTETQYRNSQWTGGTTTELAIFPETSSYMDRNFIWRLSSAVIDTEESAFSKLPDYDRVLMVMEGEVVLNYEGQRVARLKALEQDRFDGGWATRSYGKIKDFNLMVRKGNEGYLDLIFPEERKSDYTSSQESEKPKTTHALYCCKGYAVVTAGGKDTMIKPGQMLVMDFEAGEKAGYSVMGEGTLIRAQIFYDDMEGEIGPEVIPREPATFEDFKKCIYLANVQFRWAKYLIKSLKTTWFDEELSRAIKKAERFYLTSLVFMLGIVVIGVLIATTEISTAACVAAIIGWTLADCLLVSPLIYMAFVPKPVSRHIKDVDKLTPYEKKVRDEELGRNEQLERTLSKYKNSGRNLGE